MPFVSWVSGSPSDGADGARCVGRVDAVTSAGGDETRVATGGTAPAASVLAAVGGAAGRRATWLDELTVLAVRTETDPASLLDTPASRRKVVRERVVDAGAPLP